jgi:hypothetical protein
MQMFVTPAELEDIVVPFAQEDCLWLVADGFLADERAWICGDDAGELPQLREVFRGFLLMCPDPRRAAGRTTASPVAPCALKCRPSWTELCSWYSTTSARSAMTFSGLPIGSFAE